LHEIPITYYDKQTHCQVTAVSTGDSTTEVARKQLCGHISLATREHTIMEKLAAEAGGSSGTQRKGNVRHWKLVPSNEQ
jgi:hypothetical protein